MAYNIQANAIIENYTAIGSGTILTTYSDDVTSAYNQFEFALCPRQELILMPMVTLFLLRYTTAWE